MFSNIFREIACNFWEKIFRETAYCGLAFTVICLSYFPYEMALFLGHLNEILEIFFTILLKLHHNNQLLVKKGEV